MFGLEGSGFIISLGVTLLLCGVIAYYAKSQFSLMEHKITSMFELVSSLANQVNELNKIHVSNLKLDLFDECKLDNNNNFLPKNDYAKSLLLKAKDIIKKNN